jgi:hypothetical protein
MSQVEKNETKMRVKSECTQKDPEEERERKRLPKKDVLRVGSFKSKYVYFG